MRRFVFTVVICSFLIACGSQPNQGDESTLRQVNKEEVVVENIMNRRSVRNYTAGAITEEQLETIMKCAINAPSAMNLQPWEIRVVQDPDMLGKIRAINEKVIYNAPAVIMVAFDKENQFALFDCGLLTQNILLAAESMDLGTVVVGSIVPVLRSPEGKEIVDNLNLPENYEVIVAICLGQKNERPDARSRDSGKIQYLK